MPGERGQRGAALLRPHSYKMRRGLPDPLKQQHTVGKIFREGIFGQRGEVVICHHAGTDRRGRKLTRERHEIFTGIGCARRDINECGHLGICDGAGWHQPGERLTIPDNIVLLPLPPYSPELNPMENVWDYLRQNKLCATVWETYEQIIEACKTAWNWLIADPDRITSIGNRNWACVSI
jgi:transposase